MVNDTVSDKAQNDGSGVYQVEVPAKQDIDNRSHLDVLTYNPGLRRSE